MSKKILVSIVGSLILLLLPVSAVILGNNIVQILMPKPPYDPMFPLTRFPPTATPSIRPIPPLSNSDQQKIIQPIPDWIDEVYPPPNTTLPLAEVEYLCIKPTITNYYYLQDSPSPLISLYLAGEPVRDYLYLEVNGVIPSELTWENIILPNSTSPATAWIGIRTATWYCWVADLTTGVYEIDLYYPTETGQVQYTWHFTISDG